MIIKVMNEAGFEESMQGLALSYNQPRKKMDGISRKLYNKEGGHNKFLETMMVWLDILAARYFWQQFDTYRIGVTKQSESTMHTLLRQPLSQEQFEGGIFPATLERLNRLLSDRDFTQLKRELPESFLQRRVVCTNYQTIRRIIGQRKHHKLEEWKYFCKSLEEQLLHREYLADCSAPKKLTGVEQ